MTKCMHSWVVGLRLEGSRVICMFSQFSLSIKPIYIASLVASVHFLTVDS